MASFIYLYSKFTEEFLLLSAAGVFTLLSFYCYAWVVKKRRLGAARDQVPAGLVKVYLSQLINEAQFVRTQLFGLAGGTAPKTDQFAAHFQGAAPSVSATPAFNPASGTEIPSDLLERLKALEGQLAAKESMVVNINVEKSKLLEEVENLRQNEKAMGSAASGNNEDLIQKIKALEERLEEYALFEDDLANLKRLQQENTQLKKQLDQGGAAATPRPAREEPIPETEVYTPENDSLLDQAAIKALLDGSSGVPPTRAPVPEAELDQTLEEPLPEPIALHAKPAEATPPPPAQAPKNDEFENLVDSVEDSLSAQAPEQNLAAPPQVTATIAEKTDEELLKEFENLLNS